MTTLPSLFLSLSLGLAIGLGLGPGDHSKSPTLVQWETLNTFLPPASVWTLSQGHSHLPQHL